MLLYGYIIKRMSEQVMENLEELELKYHYKPKSGWMNDPNGLVQFRGEYHAFYQNSPNHEIPWQEPMHWGHAVTTDFISWKECPAALAPGDTYDNNGCWSGTAIVKDDTLYLFYASVEGPEQKQTVSIAFSNDGCHFEKYKNNPVIASIPAEGSEDFRDPAVIRHNGKYYLVIATGHKGDKCARLLIYESDDIFNWTYKGIMCQWENSKFCECPSFVKHGGEHLLSASVCTFENHYFNIMLGNFSENEFTVRVSAEVMKGPDQYAGQIFCDDFGRNIFITWIPGWSYSGFCKKSLGCLSVPVEITEKDGKIYGYPVKEVQHLLKDSDPCLELTEDGFKIDRKLREPVVHKGKIDDLKIIRDGYIAEVFVNKGEYVYMAVVC